MPIQDPKPIHYYLAIVLPPIIFIAFGLSMNWISNRFGDGAVAVAVMVVVGSGAIAFQHWKKFQRQQAGKKPVADRLSDRLRDLAATFRDRATKIDQAQEFGHTPDPPAAVDQDEADELKRVLPLRHIHVLDGVHFESEIPDDLRMKADALKRAANEIQSEPAPYKLTKSQLRGCAVFIVLLLGGVGFLFVQSEPWWAIAVILFAGIIGYMMYGMQTEEN